MRQRPVPRPAQGSIIYEAMRRIMNVHLKKVYIPIHLYITRMSELSQTLPRTFVSSFGIGRLLSAIAVVICIAFIAFANFRWSDVDRESVRVGSLEFHPLLVVLTALVGVFTVPMLLNAMIGQRLSIDSETITIRRMGILRRRVHWNDVRRIAIYREALPGTYEQDAVDRGGSVHLAFEMPFHEEVRVSEAFFGWREEELREIGSWLQQYSAESGRAITFDDGMKFD